MLQESEIIPYHVSPPQGERIIVFAPHPDDETLGCGGTIRLLVQFKKEVKVVFLTSGNMADPAHRLSGVAAGNNNITEYALLREKEAVKAMSVLGVSDYEFLRFPDRELSGHYQSVFEELLRIMKQYQPDTIYSPSMLELHPDHRTTAALSFDLQRNMREDPKGPETARIVFYEVTVPIRPNMLIDITSSYRHKRKAIKKYRSQIKLYDYLGYITSLNKIRTLTVQETRYAEAFWVIESPLNDEGVARWMSYREKM